jgi:hypothetical protein
VMMTMISLFRLMPSSRRSWPFRSSTRQSIWFAWRTKSRGAPNSSEYYAYVVVCWNSITLDILPN